jgi:ATP-dependent protease ClpP protease subunit
VTGRRGRLSLKPNREWFRIQDLVGQPGTAAIYIYDEIGYWGVTASDFVAALNQVNASQIELHLNSPGGDVFDGIAIYQALVEHPANVVVKIDSLAASAASFIAMAGNEIEIGPFAQVMIHDAHGLCIGNASDMDKMSERLSDVSNTIAAVYEARTGTPATTWREAMLEETWYGAAAAVEAGLADRIGRAQGDTTQEDTEAAVAASWDLSIFRHTPKNLLPKKDSKATATIPLPPVRREKESVKAQVEQPGDVPELPQTDSDNNSAVAGDDADISNDVRSDVKDSTTPEPAEEPTAIEEPEAEGVDYASIREALKGAFSR